MKIIKWFFFLSKRLYKKWMFILLLCLIPLFVAAIKITSTQKSGFVHIAVVNAKGETGEGIWNNLTADSGIINFTRFDDADAALSELEADRVDAVWVFPDEIDRRIAAFVLKPDEDNYIVRIIRKEESLKTRLAAEKLSGAIYPFISRPFFLKCVREDPDFDVSSLSDDEIYSYYDNYFNDDELFRFAFPEDQAAAKAGERNYLTSPIRGLLSVVTLLSGLAAAMLFLSDDKKGVFSFAKSSDKTLISFAFQLTAILNVGIFVFLSVFILGVNAAFLRETLIFLIFIINTALFCTVLSGIIRSQAVFAPVAVLLTVLDIFICPIFFDFSVQKIPQYLFPNTYYINAVHSSLYLKYSLIYSAVLILLTAVIRLRKRKI